MAPLLLLLTLFGVAGCSAPTAPPSSGHTAGGEANIHLPDLSAATFLGGTVNGTTLLLIGLVVCVGGLAFGLTSTCSSSACRSTRRCARSPS